MRLNSQQSLTSTPQGLAVASFQVELIRAEPRQSSSSSTERSDDIPLATRPTTITTTTTTDSPRARSSAPQRPSTAAIRCSNSVVRTAITVRQRVRLGRRCVRSAKEGVVCLGRAINQPLKSLNSCTLLQTPGAAPKNPEAIATIIKPPFMPPPSFSNNVDRAKLRRPNTMKSAHHAAFSVNVTCARAMHRYAHCKQVVDSSAAPASPARAPLRRERVSWATLSKDERASLSGSNDQRRMRAENMAQVEDAAAKLEVCVLCTASRYRQLHCRSPPQTTSPSC